VVEVDPAGHQAVEVHLSAATASIEADIAFLSDPDEEKADKLDGAIGELSPFHEQFGYYAQGVSVHTAVLPEDWHSRDTRTRRVAELVTPRG
jgi:hypothetical protein